MSTLKVDTLQHRDGTDYILSERNKVINGDFQVAQRATSFTSTDSANNDANYTLDRWQLFSDGNDIVDVTQETTTVPTNQLYAIALDVETANKKFGIAQKIEQKNCVDLIGQEVTLSFKAKVSATTNLDNVKCAIIAWDGTADTLTDDMISAWGAEGTDPTLATNYTYENTPANLNLTTSYATYTTTATIDTSSAKNVVVFIWSDVTTTSTGEFLYITDVQLEKGPSNSVFERKSHGQQLVDCQRYFERYDNDTVDDGGMPQGYCQVDVSNRPETGLIYTRKRANPTISGSSAVQFFTAANTNVTTTGGPNTFVGTGLYGANLFYTCSSGVSTNSLSGIGYIQLGSGDYINIDSEL